MNPRLARYGYEAEKHEANAANSNHQTGLQADIPWT